MTEIKFSFHLNKKMIKLPYGRKLEIKINFYNTNSLQIFSKQKLKIYIHQCIIFKMINFLSLSTSSQSVKESPSCSLDRVERVCAASYYLN